MSASHKATALLDLHRELGARLTGFGGWEMPLQYEGIVAEHNAVRDDCGLFDVSHLGKLLVEGPYEDALNLAVTRDVAGLDVGAAGYALVLTEDAGIVDDIFIYRVADQTWLIVPNASNVDAVKDAIEKAGASVSDAWDRWTILALQGPNSARVFQDAIGAPEVADLKLHRFLWTTVAGAEVLVARTGYTGEPGYELYVPVDVADKVFRALLRCGATPVGLGARDTLRLEMGYPLYGHELTLGTNPLEAGLGWAISWDADFRGRARLEEIREEGPARKLVGIKLHERGVPRSGYRVYRAEEPIGEVTSGNFSPTLGVGIALAYVPTEAAPLPGEEVGIEARGRILQGDIVRPPFIQKGRPK